MLHTGLRCEVSETKAWSIKQIIMSNHHVYFKPLWGQDGSVKGFKLAGRFHPGYSSWSGKYGRPSSSCINPPSFTHYNLTACHHWESHLTCDVITHFQDVIQLLLRCSLLPTCHNSPNWSLFEIHTLCIPHLAIYHEEPEPSRSCIGIALQSQCNTNAMHWLTNDMHTFIARIGHIGSKEHLYLKKDRNFLGCFFFLHCSLQ
jgi:hypothetical protein